jgi:hypothetical protein
MLESRVNNLMFILLYIRNFFCLVNTYNTLILIFDIVEMENKAG